MFHTCKGVHHTLQWLYMHNLSNPSDDAASMWAFVSIPCAGHSLSEVKIHDFWEG